MKTYLLSLPLFCMLIQLAQAGDWPGWRGNDRDDLSEETGLLQTWPEGGPKKIWTSKEGGLGYAGFSIVDDTLYTLGAFGKEERLLAFNASSGKKLWELSIGELLTNGWGDGPRMTPTVSGGMVYALGGKGKLVCADVPYAPPRGNRPPDRP